MSFLPLNLNVSLHITTFLAADDYTNIKPVTRESNQLYNVWEESYRAKCRSLFVGLPRELGLKPWFWLSSWKHLDSIAEICTDLCPACDCSAVATHLFQAMTTMVYHIPPNLDHGTFTMKEFELRGTVWSQNTSSKYESRFEEQEDRFY
eukprot:Filipodium_phascolosomae@DN7163_c0_g1_i1.p1